MSFRSKTLLADWLRDHMPSREEMARNKFLAPIAHRFLSPELWRFTRRSVPRGIALGLFCGFIIPLGQIFLAAFLALPARANVPLATLVTFITNPFTYPFWLLGANRIGKVFLDIDREVGSAMMEEQVNSESLRTFGGFFENIGPEVGITVLGLFIMAVVSAAVGYLVSSWFWRWRIARKRTRRLRRMERRLDQRLRTEG